MMRHRRKHTPAELAASASLTPRDVTSATSDTEPEAASPAPVTSPAFDVGAGGSGHVAGAGARASSLAEVLESSNVLRNLFGFDKNQLEQMVSAASAAKK